MTNSSVVISTSFFIWGTAYFVGDPFKWNYLIAIFYICIMFYVRGFLEVLAFFFSCFHVKICCLNHPISENKKDVNKEELEIVPTTMFFSPASKTVEIDESELIEEVSVDEDCCEDGGTLLEEIEQEKYFKNNYVSKEYQDKQIFQVYKLVLENKPKNKSVIRYFWAGSHKELKWLNSIPGYADACKIFGKDLIGCNGSSYSESLAKANREGYENDKEKLIKKLQDNFDTITSDK